MQIEMSPIDRLNPYDKNPRNNEGAVDAVAKPIEVYGFRQPIVVDTEGVTIVGHTRWQPGNLAMYPAVTLNCNLFGRRVPYFRIVGNAKRLSSRTNYPAVPLRHCWDRLLFVQAYGESR